MKLKNVFEKFDIYADVPDALSKIRELVLELAVQGRLFNTVGTSEWATVRIGEIMAPGLSSVNPANTPDQLFELWSVPSFASGEPEIITGAEIGSTKRELPDRSILLGKINPHLNRVWKVARRTQHRLIASPEWITITPGDAWDIDYLARLLTSPRFNRDLCSTAQGMGSLTRASTRKVAELEVRRPPLAEQKRIVAKVDELMTLCDRLEAQQQEREAQHAVLARAALARFAEAPTPANLEWIFHASFRISPSDLRKSILTLAVQGKLVPQDPNDEDARSMIDRAMDKRQQTIESKRLRRKESYEPAGLFDRADLPYSWCIERFANLVDPENTISYGVLVPGNDVSAGVPFVRAQDLRLSNHPLRPSKTIAPEIEKPYARTRLAGGEILLCVVGSIGKLGVVPDFWAGANIARAVVRIKPIPDVLRDYLLLVLQEQSVQRYFTSSTRTLAQPTLNVGIIEQALIPVPPLAEQRRIVARVDELMNLVDSLENQLAAARVAGANLLAAVIAELTNGKDAHVVAEV